LLGSFPDLPDEEFDISFMGGFCTALGMEFNEPGASGFVTNISNSQAQGIEAVSFCPFWGVG
jgi:hypothetical protein